MVVAGSTSDEGPPGDARLARGEGDGEQADGVDELVVDGRLPRLDEGLATPGLQSVRAKRAQQNADRPREATQLEPQRMDCPPRFI